MKKSNNLKSKKGIKRTVTKKDVDRTCLQGYFNYHIPLCKNDEETGEKISEAGYANICHIFPKQTYKSVMCNYQNVVYYTLNRHQRFDYLLGAFDFKKLEEEFPNSWSKVVDRVKVLIPMVKEENQLLREFKKYTGYEQ